VSSHTESSMPQGETWHGIPALRIRNMAVLPAGKLSIEEACSGLKYFLAAMIQAMLYACLNYETLRSKLVVVLVSAEAVVLLNISNDDPHVAKTTQTLCDKDNHSLLSLQYLHFHHPWWPY